MENPNAWLEASVKPDRVLVSYASRLQSIIERDLHHPGGKVQFPSTVFFIGKKRLYTVTKALFQHHHEQGQHSAFVTLDVDKSTATLDNPLYFATSNPQNIINYKPERDDSRKRESFRLPRRGLSTSATALRLYNQLFFPFVDVICILADDFQDYKQVIHFLAKWIDEGSASRLSTRIRPRVLVVARKQIFPTIISHSRPTVIEDLQPVIGAPTSAFQKCFHSVQLLRMSDDRVREDECYRYLRCAIMWHVGEALAWRKQLSVLFSTTDLAAFFELRLSQFSNESEKRFDFVTASRVNNKVKTEFETYVGIFTVICAKNNVLMHDMAAVIASSIVMDADLTGIHRFAPTQVFDTLYRQGCRTGIKAAYHEPETIKWMVKLIRYEFICACLYQSVSASLFHAENILAHGTDRNSARGWKGSKSSECCFFCINARPEHVLNCGHSMCDDCVKTFGSPLATAAYTYRINTCFFCNESAELTVHLKPPTAGVRILSVDGGGVRGIVPLQYLKRLQQDLGPDCRMQDFFDIGFGTSAGEYTMVIRLKVMLTSVSSGGLIVLGLFVQQWSVRHCEEEFLMLSSEFFGDERSRRGSSVQRWFRGIVYDSIYDVAKLEGSLQKCFGENRKMFGFSPTGTSGWKVGVTATTIKSAAAYVFSNYNGSSPRPKNAGYCHYRSKSFEDEISVWQAARATSAAPMFCKFFLVPGLGHFQDGCMDGDNNPLSKALSEMTYIWSSDSKLDIGLSLGTGSTAREAAESPRASSFRNALRDRGVPRIYRALESFFFNTERVILGAKTVHPDSVYRYDLALEKKVGIDDMSSVEFLRRSVDSSSDAASRKELAIRLVASCFFFELSKAPTLLLGSWLCSGTILCRRDSTKMAKTLERLLPQPLELEIPHNDPLPFFPAAHICPECSKFAVQLDFVVRHPEAKISICIKADNRQMYNISGFPQTMSWFVKQQRLEGFSGTRWAAGQVPWSGKFPRCESCQDGSLHVRPLDKGKKRSRRAFETSAAQKKKRTYRYKMLPKAAK